MTSPSSDAKVTIDDLQDTIIELQLKLSHQQTAMKSERDHHKKLNNTLIHHLKNAVGNANTFSEMLRNTTNDRNPDKERQYLDVINKSTGFSIALLNNYAKYLDSMTSLEEAELKTCCAYDLLEHSIDRFKENGRIQKPIRTDKSTASVRANQSDIQEAVFQVLSNALRFSPKEAMIVTQISDCANAICLTVTDFGIGIGETHLPAVTEPFYCVTTYDSNQERCAGLGLAIANNILKQNGGSLSIKSALDKGTEVIIRLEKAKNNAGQ